MRRPHPERRAAAVLCLAASFASAPLRVDAQQAPPSWGAPQSPSADEEAEIRALIDAQLRAFRDADAATAYAAAAPELHRRFPDAASFMAMARSAYAPLMAAAGRRFGQAKGAAATPTQERTLMQSVDMTDATRQVVTAVYGLARQPDGRLAITSCVLIHRGPGQT